MDNSEIERELENLIGMSAGHISYGEIGGTSFLHKAVLDAASLMWENLKSAWILELIDINGTTSWISPDGSSIAMVTIDGEIRIGPHTGQE